MRKKIVISALILVVAVGVYWWFRPRPLEEKYQLAPVVRADIRQTVTASGRIKSQTQVDLKFPTGGLLTWVGVKEGDKVKKWQAIASLDKRELTKTLQKYLLDFSKERADFDEDRQVTYRDKVLTDTLSRILAKNQYDLDKAVLDVEIKDLAVKLATITSPIAGVVIRTEPPVAGVNITSTAAIYTVADPDHLIFEAEIDETDIGLIAIGQAAELVLDAFPDKTVALTVDRIDLNASLDSAGATVYQVELNLADPAGLYLGLNGELTLITAEKTGVLTVPDSAVSDGTVRAVRNKRLETVMVETGISSGETIEIVSGLAEGERVVL